MNALAEQFIWTTQDGEEMAVQEMRTSHLFYSVRMIWNHTVPKAYQIPNCKRYRGPDQWPVDYRRSAVKAMLAELNTRTDLEPWLAGQLAFMQQTAQQELSLKLHV